MPSLRVLAPIISITLASVAVGQVGWPSHGWVPGTPGLLPADPLPFAADDYAIWNEHLHSRLAAMVPDARRVLVTVDDETRANLSVIWGRNSGLASDIVVASAGQDVYFFGHPTFGVWYGFPTWSSVAPVYRPGYVYGGYWDGRRRYWGPIDGQLSTGFVAPPPEPAPEPEPLTALEIATIMVEEGRLDEALEAYEAHLASDPGDQAALREMGVVLLEQRRFEDGFAIIRMAYAESPALAEFAIDPGLFGAGRLREIVSGSVKAAHRAGSSSAWLSVAVLMQAQSRDRVALRMLDRAEAEYLEPEIGSRLRSALGG